jgi:hypothetical protein
MEVMVRRLVTPAVRDVVSGKGALAGPLVDTEQAWADYRRAHPDRRYAIAKRMLSRRELRRHGLQNEPEE